jgi:hypothetical protein
VLCSLETGPSKARIFGVFSWLGEELKMMKASKFTEAQKAFILK